MAKGRIWPTAALATVALIIVGTAAAIDVARRDSSTTAVSQAEAEAQLARAVEYVRDRDATALCALRGYTDPESSCSGEAAGLDVRAIGPPAIVRFRTVGTVSDEDAYPPGAVLELCVPVAGETIYSEFYVVRTPRDDLVVPHPVYWLPRRITEPEEGPIVATAGLGQVAGVDLRCLETN